MKTWLWSGLLKCLRHQFRSKSVPSSEFTLDIEIEICSMRMSDAETQCSRFIKRKQCSLCTNDEPKALVCIFSCWGDRWIHSTEMAYVTPLRRSLFCSLAILDMRVGHTMDVLSPFISVLRHSDWLFHRESCPRIDVVHQGCACTWHCSLHYLFLQATPLLGRPTYGSSWSCLRFCCCAFFV